MQDNVYDGSGASNNNKYYYSLAGRLLGELNGGSTKFLLTDLLGSVVASISNTANSAAVLGNQVYGPYGNNPYSKGTITTPKGYTGQYNDSLTQLDYFNARYYDPVVGVFLSADTVQGNMQAMNPYAYVNGNPETHNDPSGRMFITEGGGGSGGLTVSPPSPQPSSCSGFWCWAQGAAHTVWNGITQGASTVAQGAVKVVDFVTGASSMVNDVRTIFSSRASFWDKVGAGADLAINAASDVLMVTGIGEAARGAELLLKGGVDLGEHLVEGEGANTLEHVAEHLGCGLSFAPATLVATAKGEQAIGTLQVGQKVWAYNPKTHKMEQEPILHVWINHDNDLVDLTLTTTTAAHHSKAATKTSETIHTNKKHPFLTKEKGFLPVGQITLGMHVLRADGTYGMVAGWKVVPGAEVMYNLEVAQDHTFTVGTDQWVVHNSDCGGFLNDARRMQHFMDHNSEFHPPFVSPEHYENAGKLFMSGERPEGVMQGRLVGGYFNGDMIRYNTITNEFGMMRSDGVLRTFYKPANGIQSFWDTMMPNGVLDMGP